VVLIGRVKEEPEIRYTPAKVIPAARFPLIIDCPNRKGDESCNIDVVVWREKAEACKRRLKKGHLVAVDGYLNIRILETSDGSCSKVIEVVAQDIGFLN
jgi:single stranded DNA-binding protein